jgi:hypothetical protein
MQTVQLYINDQRVDLFSDESIELTSSIQNVKDISKVFTDYSQSFNIPASNTNNRIFKHYYNNYIENGYDARFRSSAVIEINNTPFRKGTVRLNSVKMKNNKPFSYELTFFGSTVTLTNLLGKDKLNTLTYLNNYNHQWNDQNVGDGFGSGIDLNGDTDAVVYPLISPKYRFIYDSGTSGTALPNTRNIGSPTSSDETSGVHPEDLKPAIRLLHIIEAIEDRYDEITFSRDFFNNTDFTELYMWLHRENGTIFEAAGESTVIAGDFAVDVSGGVQNCPYDYVTVLDKSFTFTAINLSNNTTTCQAELTVSPSSSEEYEIKVIDTNTGDVLYNETGLTATKVQIINLDGNGLSAKSYNVQVQITKPESSTLTSVDVAWETVTTYDNGFAAPCTNTKNFSITSPLNLVSDIIITDHMPDMYIIDFLTSIWKMFNLTAYVDDDGVIVVKTLDDFYATYNTYDITKYVDVSNSTVDRLPLYNEIEYKFSSPVTFLANEFKDRNNAEFGSERFKVVYNDQYIDGETYLTTIPFEKVIYERLQDLADDVYTNSCYGYFVDKDENKVKGSPLIFYRVLQGQGAKPLYLKNFTDTGYISLANYVRASNVKADGSQTLNFDQENDEFNLVYNAESLFSNFHNNYISSVYDYRNRITKLEVNLGMSVLSNYKLNDRFVFGRKQYKINSVTSNLTTGKSQIELIEDL